MTGLHEAVAECDIERVRELLAAGADVNDRDEDRETLLHVAADWGHIEVVRALLDLGAQINVPGGSDPTLTPLQNACRQGHAAIAELLLQRGADPNLTEEFDGWTALHYAAFDNQPEIIKLLLDYGADKFTRSSDGQDTPLDLALHHWNREAASLLYRLVAEQHPDAYGSPLHAAANKGDAAAVEALIKSGARINGCDYEDKTPLHWAVGEPRTLLADLILEFHKVELASDATQLSQEETIKTLIEHGANLEARDVHANTPLIEAVGWGQEAAARVLIEAGADVNAQDATGWTPLLFVAARGQVDMLRLLTSRGADLQIVRNGWNALTYAAHHGHLAAAQLFIAEGVPINPPGWTPLHSAAFMGHKEIISLLLANGNVRIIL